jgi:hypothetical protein
VSRPQQEGSAKSEQGCGDDGVHQPGPAAAGVVKNYFMKDVDNPEQNQTTSSHSIDSHSGLPRCASKSLDYSNRLDTMTRGKVPSGLAGEILSRIFRLFHNNNRLGKRFVHRALAGYFLKALMLLAGQRAFQVDGSFDAMNIPF